MNLLVIFIRSMIWMSVNSLYNDFDIKLCIKASISDLILCII